MREHLLGGTLQCGHSLGEREPAPRVLRGPSLSHGGANLLLRRDANRLERLPVVRRDGNDLQGAVEQVAISVWVGVCVRLRVGQSPGTMPCGKGVVTGICLFGARRRDSLNGRSTTRARTPWDEGSTPRSVRKPSQLRRAEAIGLMLGMLRGAASPSR